MSAWGMILTRLDVVLAALAVLSALKSGYNGTVRSLINNIKQIPQVADRVDRIGDKQEKMVDGLIAVSVAQKKDDAEVDTGELTDRLREGESYRVFLERNGRSGEFSEEDPEESNRWPAGEDDD